MPRSKRPNSLFTGLILLIVAAGGLYLANKTVLSSQNQGGAPLDITPEGIGTQSEPASESNDPVANQIPDVFVGAKKGATFQLHRRTSDGDDSTVFTDADEQSKIQQLLGTDFQGAVYAWTSGNQAGASGQVATVATDGSGKLALLGKQLTSTSAPSINPSGTQIAYTGFDNSEGNFGFTLITQKISGGDLKFADSSSDGIALPRFSQNDSLAYVVGQATPDKGQELRVRIGDKSTTRFTSEKSQLISDLVWLGNDRLALVVEPLGNNTANKAKILILKPNSGDVEKTIDKPGKERSLATDSKGRVLGFIAGEMSGVEVKPGTVTLIDVVTDKESTRGDGVSIGGFLQ